LTSSSNGIGQFRNGESLRTVYQATSLGRKTLAGAKNKVRELFRKLIKGEKPGVPMAAESDSHSVHGDREGAAT
jgi:hypothetical protein